MGFKVWVVVVAVLVGGAACGGGDGGGGVASAGGGGGGGVSASASASVSAEDARLKFAQCMREQGVDVPDPGAGDAAALRLGKGAGREKLQAALKQCQQWLQAGGKLPDMKDPKKRDQYVEFAQCMREHGVDMPDPGPDGTIRLPSNGIDRSVGEKARKACKGMLPGVGE